jgi:hypothetical protein
VLSMALQIPGDGLEVGAILLRMFGIEAMINMVMDERALGVYHGLFHGMELLRDLEAGLACLDHLDHRAQMPVGAFQPGDQGGVGCVQMRF